jgi:NADPH:quinone reductase-like Zn-dependent oxidoreductase
MKAIIYDKKNRPERLICTEVAKPGPANNEVLIRIHAVSVNAADYRSMKMGLIPKKKIFGADIAGTIEAVGTNISGFKPGDEVIGDLAGCGFGGFAEYAVAPEKFLVHKPAGLSFEQAAALPMAAVTALQGLRNKGNIRQGQTVLLLGSAGGVGTFALQLANHFGAEVTAVCGSDHVEQTRSLGARNVIDYTQDDITRRPEHYDLILAIGGNYPLSACKRLLKSGGRYVMVGGDLTQVFKALLFGWLYSFGSRKMLALAAKPDKSDLDFIARLAQEGTIKPVIDRSYTLEQTPDAMRYLSAGHARGKVVITIR